MPATPTFALPYPAAADPADVPLDLQELADRLDLVLNGLSSEVPYDEKTTSASFVDLATVGPQITIPRTGAYDLSFGVNVYTETAGVSPFASLKFGAAATLIDDGISASLSATGQGVAVARMILNKTLAAGTVVKMQYVSNGSVNAHWRWRWLFARSRGA